MIIKKHCPSCGVIVEVTREFTLPGGAMTVTQYDCGHYAIKKHLTVKDLVLKSTDGQSSRPFQCEGAKFLIESDMRALLADQMGIGKTVQFLMAVHSNPKEYCPFLGIVKAKLRMQWLKETIRWCGLDFMPQILESEQDFPLPGMSGFLVSYDLLRRFKDLEAWVKNLGIKTVVMDEVQHIKNHDSKRTNAVRQIVKDVPYVVGLSGTPIKNHAGEYFPILNMLHPEKFPSIASYNRDWVDTYWDGFKYRTGGLKNEPRFKEHTKTFILRRTREEVLPELPAIQRDPLFADLGPEVEQAYKDTYTQFKQYYNNSGDATAFERSTQILAYLSRMRHLAGIAKVGPCVEYVKDFLEQTDDKIIIFVHHRDVGMMLKSQLEVLQLDNGASKGEAILTFEADTKDPAEVQAKFWSGNYRVLIASTLAAGEGLNLQCCHHVIMLERQWNPANEEQAEGRIVRMGQLANKLTAVYMVAVGTVDEFFAELVERKRSLVDNVMDGKEYSWDEQSLIKELAEILAQKGGQKWGW